MEKMKHNIIKTETQSHAKFFAFIGSVFVFFSVYGGASAALLYMNPPQASYQVGSTFPVRVFVSSTDQAINAASGNITFPKEILNVVSLSKTDSALSLWVQEPSFSNAEGAIDFEGIALNPGYIGSAGKIITIYFKVKTAGEASIRFVSGSVLANDGKGTNILTDTKKSTIVAGSALPIPSEENTSPPRVEGTPQGLFITSPTHPDPDAWYALKNATFTWPLDADTTMVRLLVGKISKAVPTVTYSVPIRSKEVKNIDDGIWYFHAQARNKKGWGDVSHFRFQIDTAPPEPFIIQLPDGKETDNPRPTIIIDYKDAMSGTDGHCEIKIDNGEWFNSNYETGKEEPDQTHTFRLPLQDPGRHTITVKAFDKAGNYTIVSDEFIITPLKKPKINYYLQKLKTGETMIIKGETSYPSAKTNIWFVQEKRKSNQLIAQLQEEEKEEEVKQYEVKNDEDGNFVFIAENSLKEGIYSVWAEVVDERGAKSEPSEKVAVEIERPALLRIGSRAIELLTVIIPLVALIMILFALLWYGGRKFSFLKRQFKKDTHATEQSIHVIFNRLRKDISEHIKMLEQARNRRELTHEEEKIIKQFKKDLDNEKIT